MKKVEKIVVIYRDEGVSELVKKALWKWFGKDIIIKPVHYVALLDEFEFNKHADLVVCLESVNNHAKIILSQWPYEIHIICLGKPKKSEDNIDYVPEIEDWDNIDYLGNKIHKKRRN